MSSDGLCSAPSACRCLNIWIEPQSPTGTHVPQVTPDPEFAPVFIGQDGIRVLYPQVTLRTRSRGVPISGTAQCTRYTSLTCLVCQTLVYRVHQVVPLDIEGKDGPQLPTDDWVEQDVMKSSSGWIEVHTRCLTGNAILEARSSPSFSETFNIILHSDQLPISPLNLPAVGSPARAQSPPFRLSSPTSSPRPPAPQVFLTGMRSLFPPPPFTPSHPAFLHFSNLAIEKSRELREAAEQDLARTVAEKRAHVEQVEDTLRREVECIWRNFRESIDKVEQDKFSSPGQRSSRSRDGDKSLVVNKTSSPGSQKATVSIRNFAPVINRSANTRSITPRISSLSASIATTSFQHPQAQQDLNRSPPNMELDKDSRQEPSSSDSSSLGSSASRTLSTQSTGSSKSASLRPKVEGGRVLEPFKRSMDPVKDTAASFQYFTILEADMERNRQREKAEERQHDNNGQPSSGLVARGRSEVVKTIANGNQKPRQMDEPTASTQVEGEEVGREESKGKRRVTFDVKPDIAANQKEAASEEKGDGVSAATEIDLIFDIDEDGSERSFSEPTKRLVLPLLIESPPPRPSRSRTHKVFTNSRLPESLVALRPASLPLPTNTRPPRVHQETDATGQAAQDVPKQARSEALTKRKSERPMDDADSLNIAEAELLKLVAASTPSHRGAWNRDSKAWQLFVRRQDGKTPFTSIIPEETEDGEELAENGTMRNNDQRNDGESGVTHNINNARLAIASSLPISINVLSRPKEALNLASYQPQTSSSAFADSNSTRLQTLGRTTTSSTALRKAAYAERDRTRSVDPGALDFAAEDDDGEMDMSDDEALLQTEPSMGERGRKRALKILQARSELPEEGMWRSLA